VAQRWTERLWTAGEPVHRAILRHPFLAGVGDGSLESEIFAEYLAQDTHYLRDYARALAGVAVLAPTHESTGLFAGHAAQTVAVELDLHARLLPELGIDAVALAASTPSPTTTAYTSYLLRVVHTGSFAEAVAAVLPCYWIYQRVGEALVAGGSPDARYQRWIDTYGGAEFAGTVQSVLDVADALGPTLSDADEAAARAHFVTTARYEWMFWDAAFRRERWPV
jgi:thiaminase/transcriptional activator TenA